MVCGVWCVVMLSAGAMRCDGGGCVVCGRWSAGAM